MVDISLLNKSQREAVEALDGPLLIVAGPGTGKTTVLTYRIAHILSATDTKPNAILAMTFTEAGVFAMRRKLYDLIGSTAYNVEITTIHGFCNMVIQEFSEYFTDIQGFTALNDIERIKFTQQILEKTEYLHLAPVNAKDLYIPDLLSVISTMKREYISPKKLETAIEIENEMLNGMEKYITRGPDKGKRVRTEYSDYEKRIAKYKEVLVFYDHYQALLKEKKRYDYEDMILVVLEALQKNAELRATLQEKYQYLMIDEYQDTNDAQNTLLFSLAEYWGEEANVFAVGDDDQAIYRFQGASVKNIVDYLGRYPNAKVITLTDNYRSQQKVLDVSREFIRNNSQSLEKTLGTIDKTLKSFASHKQKRIRLAHFHRGEAENLFIADKIKQLVRGKKEKKYENIAILVRNNADMDSIVDMLQRKKIPYVRKAGDNALEDTYVKQLLDIVRLVTLIGTKEFNDLLLVKILHFQYLNIPKLDLLKVGRAYPENRVKTFWEYIAGNTKGVDLSTLGVSQEGKDKLLEFFDHIVVWYSQSFQEPLVKMLEILMHETGMLDFVLEEKNKIKHLNALNSFFAEVKALNVSEPDMTLTEFLVSVDLMNQFKLPIKEKDLGVQEKGVQIMTAHASKGLEFDTVFIPQLYSTKWDHRRVRSNLTLPASLTSSTGELDTLEEDRRLLYVALTRARKKVYLSYSDIYSSSFGKDKEVHRSQFIDELPKKDIFTLKVTKYTKLVQDHVADLLAARPFNTVYINSIDERDVIRSIVSRFDLHPTGLNNYLECPMRFLMTNLLRIPSAISPALVYGNAYHAALEELYKSVKVDLVKLSESEFVNVFANKLQGYPLRTSQKEKLLEKGKKNLSYFYQTYAASLVVPLKTEHRLRGVISGVRIKGTVDRIDYIDISKKFLKVIDYKTGKSISASAFEGLHPSATFDKYNFEKAKAQRYYNQLLFYKVVSDLDWWITSNNAEVVESSLFFVDPEREQFAERSVTYDSSDIEDMKELIITTWQKIQNLEFPRIHRPEDSCEYCRIGDN
ncbi:ATP-dependent helicase [bacterium]|nr:ATP-dependent helicase [bacterium]